MGHFSKVCLSGQKKLYEVVIFKLTLLYVNDTVQDKILCTVQVIANGHLCDVELIVLQVNQYLILQRALSRPTENTS